MKYKEWIMILLDKIDDEEVLKRIFRYIHKLIVN
mgnify:CR=1 FL=1|jgi:hypothetical protein